MAACTAAHGVLEGFLVFCDLCVLLQSLSQVMHAMREERDHPPMYTGIMQKRSRGTPHLRTPKEEACRGAVRWAMTHYICLPTWQRPCMLPPEGSSGVEFMPRRASSRHCKRSGLTWQEAA